MGRLLKVFLCLWLCIACHNLTVWAQHPYYYNINDNSGLPSNEVYQLVQDDFGYIWIGCDAGLFRYDGFRFQQFKNKNQNSVAISGLQFGPDNTLYCQNFSGQIFHVEGDSLVLSVDVKEVVVSYPPFAVDQKNNLWVGLHDGLLKCDKTGKRTMLFKGKFWTHELKTISSGHLYIYARDKGMLKVSQNPDNSYVYTEIKGSYEKLKPANSTVLPFGSNELFVLATNNTTHFHSIFSFTGDSLKTIIEIDGANFAKYTYAACILENNLWLGTSDGAYRLSLDGKIKDHYFSGEKISKIFLDKEGTYWFSSLQKGIFAIPNIGVQLLNSGNSLLNDDNVTALKCSKGSVFTGVYTGDIYRFSPKSKKLEPLPRVPDNAYRNVTSIISYDSNTIIAARGRLSVINIGANKCRDHNSLYIRDMAVVADSLVIASVQNIGSVSNLSRLMTRDEFSLRIIKNVSGKKVCYDKANQKLWATINDGLVSIEGSNFRLFKIDNKQVFCNALYADNDGLWIGTIADGVYKIKNEKVTQHINNGNGLIGNSIKFITSFDGVLYIATDECINILKQDGTFSYIDNAEGINAKEINALAVDSTTIYIGTIRGMYYLPITTTFTNNYRPNISITSVYADSLLQDHLKNINLNYNNKDILINFSAVSLRSRGRFYYLYKISGFQDQWKRQDGSINYVQLNHLPSGNYTFEVKAVNEDGVQSVGSATLNIFVSAPFWRRWWFYVALALLTSALVAFTFILRIRKINRDADIQNQITNSQLTALKAQMNPHFMYNTLNSIQDLVLQSDIKNTNYYLSRYSQLMRKILDTSENKEIDLAEETEILQLYLELEQLRFGSDFSFAIQSVRDADMAKIQIPSMIVQPFVENAIKHGLLHKKGKKQLSVVFALHNDILKCTITDNGIGRAKAAEIKQRSPLRHKSFATKATEKRLELININRKNKVTLQINDLYADGVATGTEVLLEIPLS